MIEKNKKVQLIFWKRRWVDVSVFKCILSTRIGVPSICWCPSCARAMAWACRVLGMISCLFLISRLSRSWVSSQIFPYIPLLWSVVFPFLCLLSRMGPSSASLPVASLISFKVIAGMSSSIILFTPISWSSSSVSIPISFHCSTVRLLGTASGCLDP